jgi:hypothetical protein
VGAHVLFDESKRAGYLIVVARRDCLEAAVLDIAGAERIVLDLAEGDLAAEVSCL